MERGALGQGGEGVARVSQCASVPELARSDRRYWHTGAPAHWPTPYWHFFGLQNTDLDVLLLVEPFDTVSVTV